MVDTAPQTDRVSVIDDPPLPAATDAPPASLFEAGKEQLRRGAGWVVVREQDVHLLRLAADLAEEYRKATMGDHHANAVGLRLDEALRQLVRE